MQERGRSGTSTLGLAANNLSDPGRHRAGWSHRDRTRTTAGVFLDRTGALSPTMNGRIPIHQDQTNRSLAMSNRVSGIRTWILKTADQRLTPKIGRLPPTIQKITPQRLRKVSLTPGNLAPNLATRTEHTETGLSGWGGRTRTSEWRNQNPLPYHLATPHQAAFVVAAARGP